MEERELICICCPLGCILSAAIEGDQISITGNSCKRGAEYGRKEILSPMRTVTSSVRVEGGTPAMVPVKTSAEIPKKMIFACMKEIKEKVVLAPVFIGDVIIPNCAGTGVSVVATRKINQKNSNETGVQ